MCYARIQRMQISAGRSAGGFRDVLGSFGCSHSHFGGVHSLRQFSNSFVGRDMITFATSTGRKTS